MYAEIKAAARQRFRITIVDAQCQAKKPNRFLALELRIDSIAPEDVVRVTETCQSRDQAEPRVQLQSAWSEPDRLGQSFAGR
jgi:hypothetical protein